MKCHINLGSNIGDSSDIINRAVEMIRTRIAQPGSLSVSKPVRSAPWGYKSDNEFINVGLSFTSQLSPAQMVQRTQEIEKLLGATPHRNTDGTYRDRNIDIDIIHLGDLIIDSETLTVPHPRMHLREFVLIPLCELEPDWLHPVLNRSCDDLLKEIQK